MLRNLYAITMLDKLNIKHNTNEDNFNSGLQYADGIGQRTTDKQHAHTITEKFL